MKREPDSARPVSGADGELYRPAAVPQADEQIFDDAAAKSKDRGAFRPKFPEYHFSIDLPIDLVINTLHDRVDEFNYGLPTVILICETTRLDSDRARFTLATRDAHKTGVKLTGTMQRWEGDRTRFDVDVVLNGGQFQGNSPTVDFFDFMWILILSGLVLIVFRLAGQGSFDSLGIIPQILISVAVIIYIAWRFPLRTRRQRQSQRVSNAAQRDADSLTDVLIKALSQHDVQWITPRQP
ncbi:MAG: hypothetical protein K8I60_22550 [Anaerolineae bacterium]|nr:hypothetical protein [Anaerolineae bacterium]